jgi:3',5'-cyclic AMP phosphodiesterase CpdA
MNYMSEITDAFIEDVIRQKPDGLILSGDLTRLMGKRKVMKN